MRFLAVDDNEHIREVLSVMLEHMGVSDVYCSASAKLALDLIVDEATPFDCFLLDFQMPDMDGIELCREIRTFVQYSETPIFILTANAVASFFEKAHAAGVTGVLTKPIELPEISGLIELVDLSTNERI